MGPWGGHRIPSVAVGSGSGWGLQWGCWGGGGGGIFPLGPPPPETSFPSWGKGGWGGGALHAVCVGQLLCVWGGGNCGCTPPPTPSWSLLEGGEDLDLLRPRAALCRGEETEQKWGLCGRGVLALVCAPPPLHPQDWGQNGALQLPTPHPLQFCSVPPLPEPVTTQPPPPSSFLPPPPPGQSFLRVLRIMVLSVLDSLWFKTAAKGYCWGEGAPPAPPLLLLSPPSPPAAARCAELDFVRPDPRGGPDGGEAGRHRGARGETARGSGVHSFGRIPRPGRCEVRVSVRGPGCGPPSINPRHGLQCRGDRDGAPRRVLTSRGYVTWLRHSAAAGGGW